MKVLILYRPQTDQERTVLTFQHDFNQRYTTKVELVSLDTVEGDELSRVYGTTDTPVMIVTTDDGQVQNMWQGASLPLIDEVAGYIIST